MNETKAYNKDNNLGDREKEGESPEAESLSDLIIAEDSQVTGGSTRKGQIINVPVLE